jgi:MerR family transcriptional regulator, light-induced transcriptional regulator
VLYLQKNTYRDIIEIKRGSDMMNFGESLKIARKAKKLSQKELGDLLEIGQTTIANYEKNIRFPNKEILLKLTETLGISADTLIGESKELVHTPFSEEELSFMYTVIEDYLMKEDLAQLNNYISTLSMNEHRRIQLYEYIFKPILERVGELWKQGELSVAKEHYISEIVFQLISSMTLLRKNELFVTKETIKAKQSAICLTLSSESHAIGLRMVADYFNILGIETFYLGSNVPTDSLLEMIYQKAPTIVAISVTLEHHLDSLKNMIKVIKTSLEEQKNRYTKKTISVPLFIVGGQAIRSQEQANSLGADIYAVNFIQLQKGLQERKII